MVLIVLSNKYFVLFIMVVIMASKKYFLIFIVVMMVRSDKYFRIFTLGRYSIPMIILRVFETIISSILEGFKVLRRDI